MPESLSYCIVDDDATIHELIASILTDYDEYRLDGVAYCLADAVCFLKQHPVDIVFLDTSLPDIDGLEIFDMINYVPCVIILAAFTDSYTLSICRRIHKGICAFIEKPIRVTELVDKLETVRKQRLVKEGKN